MNILAMNAGSSTLKYRVFHREAGADGATILEDVQEGRELARAGDNAFSQAAEQIIERCRPLSLGAVGFRVVHGGSLFARPARITAAVLDGLRSLRELAPLHNPMEVAMIEAS